jgi:hypothetical protein
MKETEKPQETRFEQLVREGRIIPAKDPNAPRVPLLTCGDPKTSLAQTVIDMRAEE